MWLKKILVMISVGLEVGGTNVKAGVFDGLTGACSTVKVEPLGTDSAAREPQALIDRLVALGESVLDEQGLSWENIPRIGVACPGEINRTTGVVIGASNLPSWTNVPLAGLIKEKTKRPVTVINDASAAALAEFANRDSKETIAVLTLGTGVGLGVVCSGRVMMGFRGLTEGGHMVVEPGPNARPCPCGQRGCLEAYASATAVAAIASERMQRGDVERRFVTQPLARAREEEVSFPAAQSALVHPWRKDLQASFPSITKRIVELERMTSNGEVEALPRISQGMSPQSSSLEVASSERRDGGGTQLFENVLSSPLSETVSASGESSADAYFSGGVITAEEVFARANRGDKIAIGVVNETCDYLGLACLNICRVWDPAAILLTGELSRAEGLVEKVREAFLNRGWKVFPHECKIDLSSACKPSSPGVAGAARAALRDYVQKDQCASRKPINRRKGRYPLSAEANAALERSSPPLVSCTFSPKNMDASPKGKREVKRGMCRLLVGMGIGVCLGVGLYVGARAFRSARVGSVSASVR